MSHYIKQTVYKYDDLNDYAQSIVQEQEEGTEGFFTADGDRVFNGDVFEYQSEIFAPVTEKQGKE